MNFPHSLLPLTGFTLAACSSVQMATVEDRTLEYECDDVVVIGRLQNTGSQYVEIEGDFLGHEWFFGNVKVREVVKGDNIQAQIPVRYFSHAAMREDQEFIYVLSKSDGREYQVRSAQLMSVQPFLAARCSQPEA